MATSTIKPKRGTTAQWANSKRILEWNEWGVEETVSGAWILRVGDGEHLFLDLPKVIDTPSLNELVSEAQNTYNLFFEKADEMESRFEGLSAEITTKHETAISNIETKGVETLATIPDDYTETYNRSVENKEAIAYWSTKIGHKVYGFHVNSAESDPYEAVTYLEDAVGMTPVKMDYENGKFDWGSWKNAFFIPRPCMLNFDGTVAYYLNENDYSKKEDGTESDIANVDFGGNAMMEWGRDGKQIWYKIVPDDGDYTSYSVYIADHRHEDDYVAWSFYNKNDELMKHFYTPIYGGSLDSNNRLRSLSGQNLMHSKAATQEMTYAANNGDGYNIEVFADKLLMFLLLYLMGKSLNVQAVYGQGHSTGAVDEDAEANLTATGELDDKGLFFGYSSTTSAVKVFGMEDQWAEQWRRVAGLMTDAGVYKYKLTEGTADGTSLSAYPTTSTYGMLDGGTAPTSSGYVKNFAVVGDAILPYSVGGGSSTYYCDYFYINTDGVRFALVGGCSFYGASCGFYVDLSCAASHPWWAFGAALSYKPLIR